MGNTLIGGKFDRVLTADAETQEGTGFGLGDRYVDEKGNEYVYLAAGSNITGLGYVVTYTPAFLATMTATAEALTALGAPVAVAQAAVAQGSRGWFLVKGFGDVRTAIANANAVLAATSTAGQLDDAVGKTIERLVLTTARAGSAGLAPAVLTYPTVGATTA